MSPSHAIESLYATGHWLLEQARYDDAAVVFRMMAMTACEDERGWLALGTCHERVGQVFIASELYRLASEVASPAVRCVIARARALRVLGREDEAVELFEIASERAIEIGEDDLACIAEHERRAT